MSLKLGFDSNTSREARSVDDSEQNNAKVHVLKEREAESLARVPPLHYPNCWRSGSAIRITARAMPITEDYSGSARVSLTIPQSPLLYEFRCCPARVSLPILLKAIVQLSPSGRFSSVNR